MKKILFFVLVTFAVCPNSYAAHVGGGEISYEYIGDSTGVAHQYLVYLNLFHVSSGTPMSSSQSVQVKSSCFPDQSVSLSRGFSGPPHNMKTVDCYDGGSRIYTTIYYYRGVVTLAGSCVDFVFSWSECCRGAAGNAIYNSSTDIYIEATLNNSSGPNSSPVFVYPGSRYFCTGHNFQFKQEAYEGEGDSLYYELADPLVSPNQAVTWDSGYSAYQPVTATGGVSFSHQTGTINFIPVQSGTHLIKVKVSEFRHDSISQQWIRVGHVERDMRAVVLVNCSGIHGTGPRKLPEFAMSGATEVACHADSLLVKFSLPINCDSLAPDGTDFTLFNSMGSTIPISSAKADNCEAGHTEGIWLQLQNPISYNDTLQLVTRRGSDSNTLLSLCSTFMEEGDSLQLHLTSCTSVGLSRPGISGFSVFPNPAAGEIILNYPEEADNRHMTIMNLHGQTVKVEPTPLQKNRVILDDLPSGLYLIGSSGQKQAVKFEKL